MDFKIVIQRLILEIGPWRAVYCFGNCSGSVHHLPSALLSSFSRRCKWRLRPRLCPLRPWWTVTSGWLWMLTTTCARRWPRRQWCTTSTTVATDPSGLYSLKSIGRTCVCVCVWNTGHLIKHIHHKPSVTGSYLCLPVHPDCLLCRQ